MSCSHLTSKAPLRLYAEKKNDLWPILRPLNNNRAKSIVTQFTINVFSATVIENVCNKLMVYRQLGKECSETV